MKKLKTYASASIGLVLFITVIALSVPQTGQSAAPPLALDVRVVNNANHPVPVVVQGTPREQPFQHQAVLNIADGDNAVDAQIPVPEGKRLVIEFISINGSAPPDHQIYLSVLTHVGPDPGTGNGNHYIQYTKQDFGSFNHYTANQMVRIYADAPLVVVRLQHLPTIGAVSFRCNISGYLVDK
jgi:hypothetical protein